MSISLLTERTHLNLYVSMKQGDIVSGTPGKDSCILAPCFNAHCHFKAVECLGKVREAFLAMEKIRISAADKYVRWEILLPLRCCVSAPPVLPLHLLLSCIKMTHASLN